MSETDWTTIDRVELDRRAEQELSDANTHVLAYQEHVRLLRVLRNEQYRRDFRP